MEPADCKFMPQEFHSVSGTATETARFLPFPLRYTSSGKSSSRNSEFGRCPSAARSASENLNCARRILPEIVLGKSVNSSLRTRL